MTATPRRRTRWLAALSALGLSAAAASADVARYRLTVGQQLTYTWTAAAQPGGSAGRTTTAVYRVVDRTVDGQGWHVVGTTTDGASGEVELSSFDLWPDGRQAAESLTGLAAEPVPEFPRLPPTAAADQWQSPTAEGVAVYRPAPATRPADVTFTATTDSAMDKIYQTTHAETDTFDPARGVMVHAAGAVEQGFGAHLKQTWTRDLTADTVCPAEETARYAAQAAAAWTAVRDYSRAMMSAAQSPDPAAVAAAALAKLTAARPGVTDPVLAGQLSDAIAGHGDDVKEMVGERQAHDAVVGRPAAAFDLPDLSGTRHTLAEQRGKVVVLDFWYRDCPWCIRAMPEMKALAESYRGRPVAFFGMNNDPDHNDAAFVADFFAVPYPTLLMVDRPPLPPPAVPSGVVQNFHVQVFPTLLVIGPDGVVRQMFVGAGPTLRQDLKRAIDDLLSGSGVSR